MARSRPGDTHDAQRQRIMDAAEVVLRRHGPGKTNVVDVARELGQSHASVYRYFSSKAALIDDLVERWMARIMEPLEAIVRDSGPAADRLRAWLMALHRAKVVKVHDDPDLFAAYQEITPDLPATVARHMANLVDQVASLVAEGVATGEFPAATEPQRAARAVLNGSLAFHHPRLVAERARPSSDEEARDVFDLLILGLRAGRLQVEPSRPPDG